MPVIRSAVRSVLSDAIREAALPTQRYFSTFDPVLNTYGELDTVFTPSGDFEIEALVSTVGTDDLNIFSGSDAKNVFGCAVLRSGVVRAFALVNGVLQPRLESTTTINDGQLHAIKAVYTGTTAELFIDGVSEGTVTWALNGNQHIDYIGWRPRFNDYFDGIIANVKLTDLNIPFNSQEYLMNRATGSLEYSQLQEQQKTYLTFDPVLNSYCELDSTIELAGHFDLEFLVATSNTSTPQKLCDGDIEDSTRLDLNYAAGVFNTRSYGHYFVDGVQTNLMPADGKLHHVRFVRDATDTDQTAKRVKFVGARVSLNIAFFDGIISDVSLIDKVTPANSRVFRLNQSTRTNESSLINTGSITYNNIPESNRETFTYDESNDHWVGSNELVTNGGFDTDSDWAKGAGWSIAGGKATDTDTGSNENLSQNGIIEGGLLYRTTFDLSNRTAGSVQVRYGATGYQSGGISENRAHEYIGVSGGVNFIFVGGTIFDGSIDNVSVVRVLQPACTATITYYNLPDANRERFTFDSAGNKWVGDELWENNPIPLTNSSDSLTQNGIFEIGARYKTEFTHPSSLPTQSFRLRDSNNTYYWVSGDSPTGQDITAFRNEVKVQMNNKAISGNAYLTVKRLLEIA